jgi:hypothetical protein
MDRRLRIALRCAATTVVLMFGFAVLRYFDGGGVAVEVAANTVVMLVGLGAILKIWGWSDRNS